MINEQELQDLIMKYARVEEGFQLEGSMSLIRDLKYDSLRIVELIAVIEERIGKELDGLEDVSELIDSVGEFINFILRQDING